MRSLANSLQALAFATAIPLSFGFQPLQNPLPRKTFIEPHALDINPYQQQRLARQPYWKQFLAQHPGWIAHFDERTGLPHRAYGPPAPLPPGNSLAERCIRFLEENGILPPARARQLRHIRTTHTEWAIYVEFIQEVNNREVFFSRVTFRLQPQTEKVFMFGVDVYPIPEQDVTVVDSSTVVQHLMHWGTQHGLYWDSIVVNREWKWLADPEKDRYVIRPVMEVHMWGKTSSGLPAPYWGLVHAETGEPLYLQPRIFFVQPPQVSIRALAYERSPLTPQMLTPLKYAYLMTASNWPTPQWQTDSSGFAVLSGFPVPNLLRVPLYGQYAQVYDYPTSTIPYLDFWISDTTNPYSFWLSTTFVPIRYQNVYVHMNIIHQKLKEVLSAFPLLDTSFPAYVDDTIVPCNAFFSGLAIHFMEEGFGCYSFAKFADVVYHEYGHAINEYVYWWLGTSFQNSALHEGYADVWAIGIMNYPILGHGFIQSDTTSYIRRYDQEPKVYPDDVVGEPHATGEIIAGAWWDVAQNIGNADTMMKIFGRHYYGTPNGPDGSEGQVFQDALLEALIADDNDADLSNGTPHYNEIVCAFFRHGILLPGQYLIDPALAVYPVDTAPANQPVVLRVRTAVANPPVSQSVTLYWRELGSNTPWNAMPMTRVQGDSFIATLPGFPEGTIIVYWFVDSQMCNSWRTLPREMAPTPPSNIPFYTLIGYQLYAQHTLDDPSGWQIGDPTDNATTGIWEIGQPIPSYLDPNNPATIVQPGFDHTGNNQCAFTGNAGPGDAPGTNDIDDGKTTLYSPAFDLSSYQDPVFTYWRWYSNEMGLNPRQDVWRVEITLDGGNTWQPVESTTIPDRAWRRMVVRVQDYGTPTGLVRLRFIAEDAPPPSLVEAAVDDLFLYARSAPEDTTTTPTAVQHLAPGDHHLYLVWQTDKVWIGCPQGCPQIRQVWLVDGMGRQWRNHPTPNTGLTATRTSYVLDTGPLPTGIYYVFMEFSDGSVHAYPLFVHLGRGTTH